MRNHCTKCDDHFEDTNGAAPVLRDPIWHQLGLSKTEVLCGPCVLRLAKSRLGRKLGLDDLMPCPFNVEPNYNMERGWAEILADNPSELEQFKLRVQS